MSDRTITLISGATGGLGLATATILARDHGHHVIIGSRKAEAGDKAAKSLNDQGYAASSVQLDLDSEASILAAADYVSKTFGRLDVLVNNAAILIDSSDNYKSTYELYSRTFSANVVGTGVLTQAVLPLLKKSTKPRVVFVSSQMGSVSISADPTNPFHNYDFRAYDASKAAANMLAINFAKDLAGQGGKVNAACPGVVSTNLHVGVKSGAPPEVGARRVVQLATLGEDGPTATFSSIDGEIAW